MSAPLVSVIIPMHNEAAVIARNLQAIKTQSYPHIEIIVVDDGSTDTSVKIARMFTHNVFARKHAERSVQRNFGASKSKGQYLLFLDADMELTEEVVTQCVKTAEGDTQIGAIAIPELPVAMNFLEQVKAFERSFYSAQGDPDTDAARFFRKSAFVKVGGYDTTLTGPEDWDLPERIAKRDFRIARVETLIKHYERVPSLWQLCKKKYYYALTAHRYLAKQQLSVFGPKTIYFLRPVFYRNWRKMLAHPVLSLSMIFVFIVEMAAGAAGFLVGKIKLA